MKGRAERHSCAINAPPLPHEQNARAAGVWTPSSLSSSWWPHARFFSAGGGPGNPFQGSYSGAVRLLLQCFPPAASCCCAGLGVCVCTKSKGQGETEQVREEAVLHLLALFLANVSSKIQFLPLYGLLTPGRTVLQLFLHDCGGHMTASVTGLCKSYGLQIAIVVLKWNTN